MTHLMQWQAVMQHPGALRAAAAALLRWLSDALERLARRVEWHAPAPRGGQVEFGTIELGGRVLGAYYVDGELVSVVPDVTRW